jgi:hypothetical protein
LGSELYLPWLQNPARLAESFHKYDLLNKHLSFDLAHAKLSVDRLGYLVVTDYNLQSFVGMQVPGSHTGSETHVLKLSG